jgi:hypothetical protein
MKGVDITIVGTDPEAWKITTKLSTDDHPSLTFTVERLFYAPVSITIRDWRLMKKVGMAFKLAADLVRKIEDDDE